MQSASAPVAGVDACEGFQFGCPLRMKLAGQTTELLKRMLIGRMCRGRQNSSAGPAGFTANRAFIDDVHRAAVPGELPSDRESDNTAADDQNVMHDGAIDFRL